MPVYMGDSFVLTSSELFDLEQRLNDLKRIEGFDRAEHTTLDMCLILVSMYQKQQEQGVMASNDVKTMNLIYNLAVEAKNSDYMRPDLIQRIIDIALKHKEWNNARAIA